MNGDLSVSSIKGVTEGNLPLPAELTDNFSNHEPLPADGE
jgi:hypothetical protein